MSGSEPRSARRDLLTATDVDELLSQFERAVVWLGGCRRSPRQVKLTSNQSPEAEAAWLPARQHGVMPAELICLARMWHADIAVTHPFLKCVVTSAVDCDFEKLITRLTGRYPLVITHRDPHEYEDIPPGVQRVPAVIHLSDDAFWTRRAAAASPLGVNAPQDGASYLERYLKDSVLFVFGWDSSELFEQARRSLALVGKVVWCSFDDETPEGLFAQRPDTAHFMGDLVTWCSIFSSSAALEACINAEPVISASTEDFPGNHTAQAAFEDWRQRFHGLDQCHYDEDTLNRLKRMFGGDDEWSFSAARHFRHLVHEAKTALDPDWVNLAKAQDQRCSLGDGILLVSSLVDEREWQVRGALRFLGYAAGVIRRIVDARRRVLLQDCVLALAGKLHRGSGDQSVRWAAAAALEVQRDSVRWDHLKKALARGASAEVVAGLQEALREDHLGVGRLKFQRAAEGGVDDPVEVFFRYRAPGKPELIDDNTSEALDVSVVARMPAERWRAVRDPAGAEYQGWFDTSVRSHAGVGFVWVRNSVIDLEPVVEEQRPSRPAPSVFVSYRRGGAVESKLARVATDALRAVGLRPWLDVEHEGEPTVIATRCRNAIAASSASVIVIGPQIRTDIRKETDYFLGQEANLLAQRVASPEYLGIVLLGGRDVHGEHGPTREELVEYFSRNGVAGQHEVLNRCSEVRTTLAAAGADFPISIDVLNMACRLLRVCRPASAADAAQIHFVFEVAHRSEEVDNDSSFILHWHPWLERLRSVPNTDLAPLRTIAAAIGKYLSGNDAVITVRDPAAAFILAWECGALFRKCNDLSCALKGPRESTAPERLVSLHTTAGSVQRLAVRFTSAPATALSRAAESFASRCVYEIVVDDSAAKDFGEASSELLYQLDQVDWTAITGVDVLLPADPTGAWLLARCLFKRAKDEVRVHRFAKKDVGEGAFQTLALGSLQGHSA